MHFLYRQVNAIHITKQQQERRKRYCQIRDMQSVFQILQVAKDTWLKVIKKKWSYLLSQKEKKLDLYQIVLGCAPVTPLWTQFLLRLVKRWALLYCSTGTFVNSNNNNNNKKSSFSEEFVSPDGKKYA